MRQVFIEAEEFTDKLTVTLRASPSEEMVCRTDLSTGDLESLFQKVDQIFGSDSIHCHQEIQHAGEYFGALLGVEFLTKVVHLSTSEAIKFCIQSHGERSCRLPWELLGGSSPMGLQPNAQFVRILPDVKEHSHEPQPLIHIQLFEASEVDPFAKLHFAGQEIQSIARLFENSRIYKTRCHHNVAWQSLQEAVQTEPINIFHFSGHSERKASGGTLLLKDCSLYAEDIYKCMEGTQVRLAVLMGCETGGDVASVGHQICAMGIPMVVAMQGRISDSSAKQFSLVFYSLVAQGESVEAAMHQARLNIKGTGRDWFAPILYRSSSSMQTSFHSSEPQKKHNFPQRTGYFVGREKEQNIIYSLLEREDCRLLTIRGMGGMGKTTLAHFVGQEIAHKMADGSRLIECEALQSESDLIAAVIDALELSTFVHSQKRLLEYLADLEILLVFDCFERIAGKASVLTQILEHCAKVKIMVTSRVLLNLKEEHEFSLPPLSAKKRKKEPSEAVELFLKEAKKFYGQMDASKRNIDLISSLVVDLECVPLAIVLAAGRLRHLSLGELHQRVRENRLEVLKRRGGPTDRHADLLRVVRDSLDLLDEPDRKLLSCLSVFSKGFYLDDVPKIIENDTPLDEPTLESIAMLRDNSLLSTKIVDGTIRYYMMDTVRECLAITSFGVDLQLCRERHADCFARHAQALKEMSSGGRKKEVESQVRIEVANYRQAILTASHAQNMSMMLIFVHSLARIFAEMGFLEEFKMLVQFSESSFQHEPDTMIELRGLQGVLAYRSDQAQDVVRFWEERAELCRKNLGKSEQLADTLLDLSEFALKNGQLPTALSHLEEFDDIPKADLSSEIQASGLVIHAHFCLATNDFQEALRYAKEILVLLSTNEVTQGHLFNQMSVARIFRRCGEPLEVVVELVKKTLRQAIESSHWHSAGIALHGLYEILLETGQTEKAAKALIAGGRIPRDVSPALRERFRVVTQEFEDAGHSETLARIHKSLLAMGWTVIALDLTG